MLTECFLCARCWPYLALPMYFIRSLPTAYELGTIIVPILQMKKLGHAALANVLIVLCYN